jgi:hypothetical protein
LLDLSEKKKHTQNANDPEAWWLALAVARQPTPGFDPHRAGIVLWCRTDPAPVEFAKTHTPRMPSKLATEGVALY